MRRQFFCLSDAARRADIFATPAPLPPSRLRFALCRRRAAMPPAHVFMPLRRAGLRFLRIPTADTPTASRVIALHLRSRRRFLAVRFELRTPPPPIASAVRATLRMTYDAEMVPSSCHAFSEADVFFTFVPRQA
jgi:hypothetical protein